MYQRRSRQCCALMLIVSICLRLCMFLGLDAKAVAYVSQVAKSTDFARFLLFLETGQVLQVEVPDPEPKLWILQVEAPEAEPLSPETADTVPPAVAAAVTQPQPAPLALAPAEQLELAGACTYTVDKSALLSRPSALDFSGEGPHILIVHTHGTEAYTPEPGWEYKASTTYRTLDPSRSVVAVGEALARTLEAQGLRVLHDATLNDYPSYNDSYWTTLSKIEAWKQQYPSLQMVIDVHRDAVEDHAGNAVALSASADGTSCARLMLVVGTDQGGLSHPNWQENLANALKLQSVLEGSNPGLCRSLDLRTERFNQHATPGSLLVEVGTNGNTLQQALRSAELLGNSLARMIIAIKENDGLLLPAATSSG